MSWTHKNGGALHEFQDKSTISGKDEEIKKLRKRKVKK